MQHPEIAISVRDLRKRFGDLPVLNGVSLTARKGDILAIIGSSGSGKSTLLRCINFLEMPDSGEIAIEGEPIPFRPNRRGVNVARDAKQVERIRAKLGMVFQQFNLWSHMTVLENIIEAPMHVLGLSKKEATARAEMYLGKVGLIDKRNAYPALLSGGQQQRAAIARALAMEPTAILFDEPTSALDPELVGEVLQVIRALAQEGRTMIVVTHEIGFAREVAGRVIFLNNGEIEEEGPPAQVLAAPRSERLRLFLASYL